MKRNSFTPPPCSSVQHGGASPVAACFCSLLTLLLRWWKSVDSVLLLLLSRFMAVISHYRPPLVILTNCIRTASLIHYTVFHECGPHIKIIWSKIASWRKYNTGHMWSAPTTGLFYLLSYWARQDRRWNQTWPKNANIKYKISLGWSDTAKYPGVCHFCRMRTTFTLSSFYNIYHLEPGEYPLDIDKREQQ